MRMFARTCTRASCLTLRKCPEEKRKPGSTKERGSQGARDSRRRGPARSRSTSSKRRRQTTKKLDSFITVASSLSTWRPTQSLSTCIVGLFYFYSRSLLLPLRNFPSRMRLVVLRPVVRKKKWHPSCTAPHTLSKTVCEPWDTHKRFQANAGRATQSPSETLCHTNTSRQKILDLSCALPI